MQEHLLEKKENERKKSSIGSQTGGACLLFQHLER
jgi:hypothetical protein